MSFGSKGETPSMKVELTLSAKNLINRDTLSKSDPMAVIYLRDLKTNELLEVGRTEVIKNNLNPTWEKKFTLDYRFEEKQEMKITVYDWDGDEKKLSADHDYLGSMICTVGEVVSANYSKFERKLDLPKKLAGKENNSTLIIYSEELGAAKESFRMTLSGKGLDKKDLIGKSDPFAIISRKNDEEGWKELYTTEVVKKSLDPEWRPIEGQTSAWTLRNPTRPLLFQVFDHDKVGKHDLIGEFETTWQELCTMSRQSTPFHLPLINPKKRDKKKEKYENSGMLYINLQVDETNYTFVDYLQAGVQLHFTVAVDFTASNGNPNDPKSLHSRVADQDNQYTIAIKAIGSIVEDYDYDRHFPALGFGAKIPPSTEVSHLFFLNFDPQNPFCKGVDGILDAYQTAIKKVKLYGPTHFSPVINHVAQFAQTYQDGRHYFVLLIITDGMICDLDATRDAIVEASKLPLSIIIVGVGNEDFSSMEFLDADKRALKHQNGVDARDICQFVSLRDILEKHGGDSAATRAALGKQVLAEIPKQLCDFMHQRKTAFTNL